MRRAPALAFIILLAVAVIVGCGSSSSSKKPAAAPTSTDTNKSVAVSGQFGKQPTVNIPKVNASGSLYTKTISEGTGATMTATDGVYGNFAVYDWSGKTSKLLGSSYTSGGGGPSLFVGGQMPLQALQTALVGQKIGSRVLAVVPPADGFGSNSTQLGIGTNDTLVWVIDMDSAFGLTSVSGKQTSNGGGALPTVVPPANSKAAPTVDINTKAAPPKTLQVKPLIKGTGPVVKTSAEIVVNYNGYVWRTGKSFQSSWSTPNTPLVREVGAGQLIQGWDTGLIGQTVGSRVLLVAPPADAYPSNPPTGIKTTDTLVFVIDIIDAAGS